MYFWPKKRHDGGGIQEFLFCVLLFLCFLGQFPASSDMGWKIRLWGGLKKHNQMKQRKVSFFCRIFNSR